MLKLKEQNNVQIRMFYMNLRFSPWERCFLWIISFCFLFLSKMFLLLFAEYNLMVAVFCAGFIFWIFVLAKSFNSEGHNIIYMNEGKRSISRMDSLQREEGNKNLLQYILMKWIDEFQPIFLFGFWDIQIELSPHTQ